MSEQILQDRIGEYLISRVNNYLFDELSPAYLEKAGVADILTGVPVPVKTTELTGLTNLKIAENMAVIIGCDINFKYRENYIEYIVRTFTKDFVKPLINEGIDAAAKEDYNYACVCFRAALLIDPESVDALYCYGRACKDSYEQGEDEEYIGRYKAESLEAFEKLTIKKPDFDMGFYFLGYGYLNLGLYIKAKLTWEEFLKLSSNAELIEDVNQWLRKLEEPVKIEQGYNAILSSRFDEGIAILENYRDDDRFNTWWPLWYYLGVAYKNMGELDKAQEALLKTLQLSPSNTDAMEELVEIYSANNDAEKAKKYSEKIELIERSNQQIRNEMGNLLS